MVCNLELILEVCILILEHLCLLDDAFCLGLVLLLVDLIIKSVLL